MISGYLPSLSINYVDMSKDMGKRLPQLYHITMKICYDLGFIAVKVAMATLRRHDVFYFSFFFLRNRLREFVPAIIASIWQSLNKFYESVFGIL